MYIYIYMYYNIPMSIYIYIIRIYIYIYTYIHISDIHIYIYMLKLNMLSVVKTWSTTDAVAILARGRHPDVLHALSQDNFAMVCLFVLVY